MLTQVEFDMAINFYFYYLSVYLSKSGGVTTKQFNSNIFQEDITFLLSESTE